MITTFSAALAQTLADFIVILGKELTVSNLLPLIKWMLESKDVNVCLNVISKIKQIVDVIGFDIFMDNIFGTVAEMFESNNWRIKLCAIETFPILAMNIVCTFKTKLNKLLTLNFFQAFTHFSLFYFIIIFV